MSKNTKQTSSRIGRLASETLQSKPKRRPRPAYDSVVELAKQRKSLTVHDVTAALGVSQQRANKILLTLVLEGVLGASSRAGPIPLRYALVRQSTADSGE